MREVWWFPLWRFMIHAIVGTGIFILIATPAVFLNLIVQWLEEIRVTVWILAGLQIAEYSLFLVDLVLFLVFLAKTASRTIPRL